MTCLPVYRSWQHAYADNFALNSENPVRWPSVVRRRHLHSLLCTQGSYTCTCTIIHRVLFFEGSLLFMMKVLFQVRGTCICMGTSNYWWVLILTSLLYFWYILFFDKITRLSFVEAFLVFSVSCPDFSPNSTLWNVADFRVLGPASNIIEFKPSMHIHLVHSYIHTCICWNPAMHGIFC